METTTVALLIPYLEERKAQVIPMEDEKNSWSMSYCTFGAAQAMPDQPEETIYLRERCRLCLCTLTPQSTLFPPLEIAFL